MKSCVKEDGVVVYNVSSSKNGFHALCEKQFTNLFSHLYTQKTNELNVVYIASNRDQIPVEKVNECRTETNQHYMEGFSFTEELIVC